MVVIVVKLRMQLVQGARLTHVTALALLGRVQAVIALTLVSMAPSIVPSLLLRDVTAMRW